MHFIVFYFTEDYLKNYYANVQTKNTVLEVHLRRCFLASERTFNGEAA